MYLSPYKVGVVGGVLLWANQTFFIQGSLDFSETFEELVRGKRRFGLWEGAVTSRQGDSSLLSCGEWNNKARELNFYVNWEKRQRKWKALSKLGKLESLVFHRWRPWYRWDFGIFARVPSNPTQSKSPNDSHHQSCASTIRVRLFAVPVQCGGLPKLWPFLWAALSFSTVCCGPTQGTVLLSGLARGSLGAALELSPQLLHLQNFTQSK